MSPAHGFSVVKGCPGRFPIQVVDGRGWPHPQLTAYANKAAESLSTGSASAYLGEVLRLFSWAASDCILQQEGQHLLGPAEQVRQILYEYLVADCKCVARHRQDQAASTIVIVRTTQDTRVNVKMTLSAMKHFYGVLASCDLYSAANPLVSAELANQLSQDLNQKQMEFRAEHGRGSPRNSGGVDDNWQHQLRYSTNFFQLADGEWRPQIISDSRLPSLVYKAGERFGWSLRSEVIARMLFESGGRISDVVLRSFGDWLRHDCLNRMASDSKGSHGHRVKTLAFTTGTANLLRRYFNTERAAVAKGPFKTFGETQRAAKNGRLDADTVPIFLSRSGRQYSPASFRDDCWRPAMRAAGIKCQPHQTRHWCVTAALDEIDKTSSSDVERERRRHEFVTYMRWKSGEQMLATYDHSGTREAANMASLHDHMRSLEERYKKERLEDLRQKPLHASNRGDELEAIFRLVNDDRAESLP